MISFDKNTKRSSQCAHCYGKIPRNTHYLLIDIHNGALHKHICICPRCLLKLNQKLFELVPDLPEQIVLKAL